MAGKFPGIPALSLSIAKELMAVIKPMREIVMSLSSGDTDRAVTVQDLIDINLVQDPQQGASTEILEPYIDYLPPPAPTGLTTGGALANVILEWDIPSYTNIAYAEVWRANADNINAAERIGSAPGQVYVDNIGSGATRYYWIRYVSKVNVTGPFNAQAGVIGQTAYDASYLIDVLAANPPVGTSYNQLLYLQPSDITIDGTLVPAGVYMTSAYIRKLSVSNAQIENLAVDSAKIAALAVGTAKIADAAITTAKIDNLAVNSAKIADLAVTNAKIGSFIQSTSYSPGVAGWHINKDGTAEFRNVLVRGDVQASSLNAATGTIGLIRSATSGQRCEFDSTGIRVYDSGGTLRARLGTF